MKYPLMNHLSPLSRAYLQDWLFTYCLQNLNDLDALDKWRFDRYAFTNRLNRKIN